MACKSHFYNIYFDTSVIVLKTSSALFITAQIRCSYNQIRKRGAHRKAKPSNKRSSTTQDYIVFNHCFYCDGKYEWFGRLSEAIWIVALESLFCKKSRFFHLRVYLEVTDSIVDFLCMRFSDLCWFFRVTPQGNFSHISNNQTSCPPV